MSAEDRAAQRETVAKGKRWSLSVKTSLEVNLALKRAAAVSGRSVSQEVEMRLERSFALDDTFRAVRETVREEMRAEREAMKASNLSPLTFVSGLEKIWPPEEPPRS